MKYIKKQISEELFPNFSPFNRAINYPYFAPDYSFSFYKGKFVKGISHDLTNSAAIQSMNIALGFDETLGL